MHQHVQIEKLMNKLCLQNFFLIIKDIKRHIQVIFETVALTKIFEFKFILLGSNQKNNSINIKGSTK